MDPKRTVASPIASPAGMTITGVRREGYDAILDERALDLVAELARRFGPRVAELLERRRERQRRIDAGLERLDFLPETRAIREASWTVAPPPADLRDRRVEITGPVERKMIINALNSGATHFMADLEDSNSPTWDNNVTGQINLRDAVRRTIEYTAPDTGKQYRLNPAVATLMVRPRGWHLVERYVSVDGRPVPAGLFDAALFLFHNAREQLARGTGPYLYLPKLEGHLEARLWNDVLRHCEDRLGIPHGAVRATVLVETLPAAFEMDEILWELRERSAGLNCGRWDYIFSFIKKLHADPSKILPDRGQVTMDRAFLHAYSLLVIKTCHRRGAHAMGGMAAQIPIKDDPVANEAALAKVRADKLREVGDGHDGTWVAHPGLVGVAKEIFDAQMPGENQVARLRDDVHVGRDQLLAIHEGTRTEAGLRHNVRVGVQYIEAWLRGSGCVPIYNLMEDAATAEISRAQAWQWLHYRASLIGDDGREAPLDHARFLRVVDEEMERIAREVGRERMARGRFTEARALFERLCTAESFVEFLTLPAYELLAAPPETTATPRGAK
jgi:malate synthase A